MPPNQPANTPPPQPQPTPAPNPAPPAAPAAPTTQKLQLDLEQINVTPQNEQVILTEMNKIRDKINEVLMMDKYQAIQLKNIVDSSKPYPFEDIASGTAQPGVIIAERKNAQELHRDILETIKLINNNQILWDLEEQKRHEIAKILEDLITALTQQQAPASTPNTPAQPTQQPTSAPQDDHAHAEQTALQKFRHWKKEGPKKKAWWHWQHPAHWFATRFDVKDPRYLLKW